MDNRWFLLGLALAALTTGGFFFDGYREPAMATALLGGSAMLFFAIVTKGGAGYLVEKADDPNSEEVVNRFPRLGGFALGFAPVHLASLVSLAAEVNFGV